MKKGEQFKKANLLFSTNILSWGSRKKDDLFACLKDSGILF